MIITSDDIQVPTETKRDTGQPLVYCEGCKTLLGMAGYGEEFGHSVTECLIMLRELLARKEQP